VPRGVLKPITANTPLPHSKLRLISAIILTSTILTNNPFLVSMDGTYFDPVTFSAFTYQGAGNPVDKIHIELAQVRTTEGERRIEEYDFVEKGVRYSKRFCQQISGLCRHVPISVITRHYGLRWETIKNIDKASQHRPLPPSEPSKPRGLKRIGFDEVAKAKGHDYMTVVYDMDNGQLIWVEHGRTHRVR